MHVHESVIQPFFPPHDHEIKSKEFEAKGRKEEKKLQFSPSAVLASRMKKYHRQQRPESHPHTDWNTPRVQNTVQCRFDDVTTFQPNSGPVGINFYAPSHSLRSTCKAEQQQHHRQKKKLICCYPWIAIIDRLLIFGLNWEQASLHNNGMTQILVCYWKTRGWIASDQREKCDHLNYI